MVRGYILSLSLCLSVLLGAGGAKAFLRDLKTLSSSPYLYVKEIVSLITSLQSQREERDVGDEDDDDDCFFPAPPALFLPSSSLAYFCSSRSSS